MLFHIFEKSLNNKIPKIKTTTSWFILIFFIKSIINLWKAYSSKVERTAHNGFVVGSSPTKPK